MLSTWTITMLQETASKLLSKIQEHGGIEAYLEKLTSTGSFDSFLQTFEERKARRFLSFRSACDLQHVVEVMLSHAVGFN